VAVTISDDGCDPRSISTQAGPVTFDVTNDGSASVTEFEVLDGDGKIVGEVENVIPGNEKSFSVTLKEGKYTSYCPNGTVVEKGTIEVAAGGGGAADSAERRDTVDTYLKYVSDQSAALTDKVGPFVAAVKAGDVDKAKQLFAGAREPYERIEPIAESFGDLDPAIDAREGDVPAAEWGGFHRIEKALWVDGQLDGMGPVADELATDVADLQKRIGDIELEPAQVANGAVGLLDEVSVSKITGEEDRYSHTDLSDFAANVDGAEKAFEAVKPLLPDDQADLSDDLDQRFKDVDDALAKYAGNDPTGNGYVLYTDLNDTDTRGLSTVVDALAEPLSRVAALVIA
jgi:iron uptake system component EfeO